MSASESDEEKSYDVVLETLNLRSVEKDYP